MGSLIVMAAMMGGMAVLGAIGFVKSRRAPAEPPVFALSPVSGARVAVTSATPRAVVGGKTFYFEDEDEQRRFVVEPAGGPSR